MTEQLAKVHTEQITVAKPQAKSTIVSAIQALISIQPLLARNSMFSHSSIYFGRSFAKQTSLAILTLIAFMGTGLKADNIEILNTSGTNNVAVAGQYAFAAAGAQGIIIVDLSGPRLAGVIAPPGATGTIDDVSIDGDLLFTLDAAGSGGLSVFSIENPMQPTLVSGPVTVDVSPFAGVSAANRRVVVSGGTGLLSSRSYQANGTLGASVSSITTIDISEPTLSILDRIGIAGAGFSPGADSPANFPIESAQSGNTLYVASGNGVSVFDTSNPNAVQTLAQIPLNTNPVNIDIFDNVLYVVGNSPTPTLTSIDVSELSEPVIEVISLPSGSRPLGVAATSTRVVIADSNLGILIETLLLLGDVNQDCSVNFSDISPFIAVLTTGGMQAEADIDQNGTVNFADISPFIAILSGT